MNQHVRPNDEPHNANPHEAIAKAMCDLETRISGLCNMAAIMADMLDDNLTDIRTIYGDERPAGGNFQIVLTQGQMDQLCFAWNDVVARAVDLEKAFEAAAEGEAIAPTPYKTLGE